MRVFTQAILAALATSSPQKEYRSRPDLTPPKLNITIPAENSISSEYLFLAPFSKTDTLDRPGPYIYRKDGDLVWAGTGYYAGFVGNFHPTIYKGKSVLQAFQGTMDRLRGEGFGQHVLLDQNYRHIVTSMAANHRVSSLHEFNVVAGETALIEVFDPIPVDLSAYGGNASQRWLGNGIFQEVDIATGDLIFEWSALEHVDPAESLVTLGSTRSNSGMSFAEAWDYFHINSLDKNDEGNYLLSSRHTSTIFKINGTDGSVIWRLGGTNSSFIQAGNWTFGFQHDARWYPRLSQPGTEVIAFLDNSSNGDITLNNASRALIVQLNHTDNMATILRQVTAPNNLLPHSQGNAQLLSNDHIFVNWGSAGAVTEFGTDNEIQYHAVLESGAVSYRGFLCNWTGTPTENPALTAFQISSNHVELYVSWNGDTETKAWRFIYLSGGKRIRVGQVNRASFETVFIWEPSFALSTTTKFIAQALGKNGEPLAQTGLTAAVDLQLSVEI